MSNYLQLKKVSDIFGGPELRSKILSLEEQGEIPPSQKYRSGAIYRKGWPISSISKIGEKVGFFKKFNKSIAISVFTTKGGVLKSTLSLNLARIAALHGMKVCVVGLDIQGDVTTALGHNYNLEGTDKLEQIIEKLDQTNGLNDFFVGQVKLEDIILQMGIPNLFVIPETPELVALNDSLNNINRREFWLREKIVEPLKNLFDLVIMDCSPNWNKLTTNALVASDALISPLECKINNFRNFKVFFQFLTEFKNEMNLDFESIFIPTKYCKTRKLSHDIFSWYFDNVEGCTSLGIRESVASEEAMALNLSVIEHVSNKDIAKDMIVLFKEIHARITRHLLERESQALSNVNSMRVSGTEGLSRFEERF